MTSPELRPRRAAVVLFGAASAVFSLGSFPGSSRALGDETLQGNRSLTVSGMSGQGFIQEPGHGYSEFATALVGIGMEKSRRIELRLELYPVFLVRQPRVTSDDARETVGAAAIDIGLRWYTCPPTASARPYVELLAGPLYGFRHIPEPGSAFNFLTQFAAGATVPVGARARFVAAYRWVHISNAGTSHYNPSWNYSTLEFGARWEYP